MTKSKLPSLHIVPSGGFSAEIRALAKRLGYSDFVFYDERPGNNLMQIADFPQTGSAALAAGSSGLRKKLTQALPEYISYPNLIDPSVIFLDEASLEMGRGTIICAGSILTTNISIGDFVLINLHCSIGHDVILEDYCSLMPGVRISGGVQIGQAAYLGTNAVILPKVKIGENAVIGAGAVVTKDVAPNTMVVGVPAQAKN